MESMAQKLRSGKFLQECGKIISKDVLKSKRFADPLPDNGGKKRMLGDITNRIVQPALCKKEASLKTVVSESKEAPLKSEPSKNVSSESDSLMYVTALEDSVLLEDSPIRNKSKHDLETKENIAKSLFPPGVEDFDKACGRDPLSVTDYAQEVFKYYRNREVYFPVTKYLDRQPEISKAMRAILVDWMVEVQENFELNHETLYLAVKLVDRYLMVHSVMKKNLQLLGATAVFVAAKFDERLPPLVDDFLYICDDSYSREDLLNSEINVLKTVDFDLGIPLSYRFLRRYSRCARISMELLTLARFILEIALMDYDLIDVLDSKIAAAVLLLALKMKHQTWTPTLQHYSGYAENELYTLLVQLNKNISASSSKHLQTIRTKYSHQIFFHVSRVPPLNLQEVPRLICQSEP